VVGSLGVINQLLDECSTEVKLVRTSQVEDADHRVSKLHFQRFAVRQMVIHPVLAGTFHCLTDFTVYETQTGRDGLRVIQITVIPPTGFAG
jgi:hypothetical protein